MAHPLTDEIMLELCFAIILPALAAALLFFENASGGGTDIIAMIIKKYSTMNISTALLVTDLIVVILAFLIFDTLTGLCSVLGLMAKTLLIDKTIERMKLNKFFTIISNNPQPICDFITKDLNHSATLYDAVGAYSDQQRTVILTVVDVKQAVYLQRFIHDTEPTAFIAITKSSEIIGKGFMSYVLIDSTIFFTQKIRRFFDALRISFVCAYSVYFSSAASVSSAGASTLWEAIRLTTMDSGLVFMVISGSAARDRSLTRMTSPIFISPTSTIT